MKRAGFKMRTGNSPMYKELASSFQPPSYDYEFGGSNNPASPGSDDDDTIIIDDSKTEKIKPADLKTKGTDKMSSTSSRPSGEEFVTKEPTPSVSAESTGSSGMSDATKATIIGEIGKIGDKMSARAKEASSKSFGQHRAAFNKKSPYRKGIGSYDEKAKGSRGFDMNKNSSFPFKSPMKQDLTRGPKGARTGPVEDPDRQMEKGVISPGELNAIKNQKYLDRQEQKKIEKTKKKIDIAYSTLKK